VPTPADYDGDGRADVALWRNSNATFYVLNSSTNTLQTTILGQSGDKPVSADFDGDGRADAALYRSTTNNWLIRRSGTNQVVTEQFGQAGDEAVRGDFDGDGRFDVAVMRKAADQWLIKQSTNGQTLTIALDMEAEDLPVAGDYAESITVGADGKTDAAVWRPSTGIWYIRLSRTNQMRSEQWGMAGDTPIAAPFRQ
jgi:hypothetical protein